MFINLSKYSFWSVGTQVNKRLTKLEPCFDKDMHCCLFNFVQIQFLKWALKWTRDTAHAQKKASHTSPTSYGNLTWKLGSVGGQCPLGTSLPMGPTHCIQERGLSWDHDIRLVKGWGQCLQWPQEWFVNSWRVQQSMVLCRSQHPALGFWEQSGLS